MIHYYFVYSELKQYRFKPRDLDHIGVREDNTKMDTYIRRDRLTSWRSSYWKKIWTLTVI